MTHKEALEKVTECGLNIEEPLHSEVMELVKAALEKQIPKKPIKINEDYEVAIGRWIIDWECPNCGNPYADDSFCSCCGQALDWSDTE